MAPMTFEEAWERYQQSFADMTATKTGEAPAEGPKPSTWSSERKAAYESGKITREEWMVDCLAETNSHLAWIRNLNIARDREASVKPSESRDDAVAKAREEAFNEGEKQGQMKQLEKMLLAYQTGALKETVRRMGLAGEGSLPRGATVLRRAE
ncbi:hypothetical protein CAC42_1013 [Sphaceloma murrayae]|uniref:Uncharacterized protein n=1 Tax=Sphaceloma murrayae TaxID=2082308 RepID=A0A2K1R1R9_9PEZI|nr:hypothetical protein CAC42_1013 [Sphaceloma murrayae]